jgi:hypothetical protein
MKFKIIDVKGFLALQSDTETRWLYRCIIHGTLERAKQIVSRYSIGVDDELLDFISPWRPVLADNYEATPSVLPGKIDSKARGEIRGATKREEKWEHLRYQDWQLYVCLGDTGTITDSTIAGYWEKIPVNVDEIVPDSIIKILGVGPGGPPPTVGP